MATLFHSLLWRQIGFVVMTVRHYFSDPGEKNVPIIKQNFPSQPRSGKLLKIFGYFSK